MNYALQVYKGCCPPKNHRSRARSAETFFNQAMKEREQKIEKCFNSYKKMPLKKLKKIYKNTLEVLEKNNWSPDYTIDAMKKAIDSKK